MKKCQPCGTFAAANAHHCAHCGEASWRIVPVREAPPNVEPLLDAIAEHFDVQRAEPVVAAVTAEVDAVAPLLASLPVEDAPAAEPAPVAPPAPAQSVLIPSAPKPFVRPKRHK